MTNERLKELERLGPDRGGSDSEWREVASALLAVYERAEKVLARPTKSIGAEILAMYVAYGAGCAPSPDAKPSPGVEDYRRFLEQVQRGQRLFSDGQVRSAIVATLEARSGNARYGDCCAAALNTFLRNLFGDGDACSRQRRFSEEQVRQALVATLENPSGNCGVRYVDCCAAALDEFMRRLRGEGEAKPVCPGCGQPGAIYVGPHGQPGTIGECNNPDCETAVWDLRSSEVRP